MSPTGWLNGNIINAAQDLLKKQFSNLHGLQDVNLGLVVNFKVSQHEFVQILHSSPDHWVAISTIGVEESNVVLLFDSKYDIVTNSVKAQIASLLCTASGKIVVNIMKVQNQVSASQIYSEMLLIFFLFFLV